MTQTSETIRKDNRQKALQEEDEVTTYSGAYPFNFRWRIQSQNRVK